MFDNTQIKLVELRNELRAQKQASNLSYGQLSFPESAPTASWSGSIDITSPISTAAVAKFKVTFTRSDGRTTPPLVDLAFDYSTSPTGISTERTNGATISLTSEASALEANGPECCVTSTSESSVVFTIEFPPSTFLGLYSTFSGFCSISSVALTLTVQAISPVVGTLSVERIYDV